MFQLSMHCFLIGICLISIISHLFVIVALAQSPSGTSFDLPVVNVVIPSVVLNDPKYRVDCAPDIDENRTFCELNLSFRPNNTVTSDICAARGCNWDTAARHQAPSCYIPIEKGGYTLDSEPVAISSAINQFNLTRVSTRTCVARSLRFRRSSNTAQQYSLFNRDVNHLNVQVSVSGTDKIRLTIRDANRDRYEVPVPIQWQPSAPSSIAAKMNFQITKNPSGQIGFRVVRTKTSSILFDTTAFVNGFVYDDRYLQIITTTSSRNVYGNFPFPS